jgi:hypothetical protein
LVTGGVKFRAFDRRSRRPHARIGYEGLPRRADGHTTGDSDADFMDSGAHFDVGSRRRATATSIRPRSSDVTDWGQST